MALLPSFVHALPPSLVEAPPPPPVDARTAAPVKPVRGEAGRDALGLQLSASAPLGCARALRLSMPCSVTAAASLAAIRSPSRAASDQ